MCYLLFGRELADRHVVGCGDRTISMWDHYNGNLLIDFEIDLPTIGRNIGCFTIDVDVSITLPLQLITISQHQTKTYRFFRNSEARIHAINPIDIKR